MPAGSAVPRGSEGVIVPHRDGEQNVAISIGFVDIGGQDDEMPAWMEKEATAAAKAPSIGSASNRTVAKPRSKAASA